MAQNNPKGIPPGDHIWTRTEYNGKTFYTTTKGMDRSVYYLYVVTNGKAEKLGKSPSPKELDEKYIYD